MPRKPAPRPPLSTPPKAVSPAPAAARAVLGGEALVLRIVELARERRGEDLVALDVRGLCDYMDYLVLATGRSPRQNRSIAEGVMRGLKGAKVRPLHRPDREDGPWLCLDFVDVVFHVFDGATRAHYDLELLWSDAKPVTLPDVKPLDAEPAAAPDPGEGQDEESEDAADAE